jgi:serine/threonine-protein kinase
MSAPRSPADSKRTTAVLDTPPQANLATRSYLPPTAAEPGGASYPEPAPGDLIGTHYCLSRRIAVGGMGSVYEARCRRTGRPVAVKLLPAAERQDRRLRQALRAETDALCRVRHANVLLALDHGDLPDGSPYLVLEWLDGGNVAEALRNSGGLSPFWATRFAIAACRALRAVHRAGLLHLDVKPANLLLDGCGRVKLADFGLCVSVNPSGRAHQVSGIGTPAYFAPEQAAGFPVDCRTDLYSLGVTFFEMLTGRRPFTGDTLLQCVRAHVGADVPCPRSVRPDVPEACAAIARRAMAKEPSRRFADAGRMLTALEKTLVCLAKE